MSTPFLLNFAATLLEKLEDRSWIEVTPGSGGRVVLHLASHLATVGRGSLISAVSEGLIACTDVEELWADDDQIKDLVVEMGAPRLS